MPRTAPARRPHNIPEALSSFVGRQAESEELERLVHTVRLLTVVGAGGAGKTRVVRELAARLANDTSTEAWLDGIWWVELAPVRASADVASALAAVLSVSPSPGRPMLDALLDALQHRAELIVLDNCEHVIDDVAQLADAILRRAPEVTIIATSRERLAIDGEVAWPVPPLERPPEEPANGWDAGRLASFEAVRLFVDRTRAVSRTFSLTDENAHDVAAICKRLDGLPLALELAAAVVPVIGIAGLASRLDDALSILARGRRTDVPRHRTLRAVLDWSYDLLDDEARALLRHLAVFRGACTLDAMAEVCARRPDALVVPLGRLLEHSLVDVRESPGETRYRLLETVRQYGVEKLHAAPDASLVQRRHAGWITRVAQRAEDALFSPARGRTVRRLQADLDEIRGALVWALSDDGDAALGVELTGALAWFWISGVPWEEARTLPRQMLARLDADGMPDAARDTAVLMAIGRLSYAVIGLAYFAGDTALMLSMGARELAIWDIVEARATASGGIAPSTHRALYRGRSLCNQLMGLAEAIRGNATGAVAHLDTCIAMAVRSGEPWLLRVMQMRRALVHFTVGDLMAAEADFIESIDLLRAMGEWWFLSLALEGLAITAFTAGDPVRAARYARESITTLRPEPDAWFVSRSLDSLAYILVESGEDDDAVVQAAQWTGAAEGLREQCGAGIMGNDIERIATTRERLHSALGHERTEALVSEGRRLTLAQIFDAIESSPTPTPPAPIPSAVASAVPSPTPVPVGSPSLSISLLNGFRLQQHGTEVAADRLPAGKVRELLCYLALTDHASKEAIGLALWPDASDAQLRNVFHVTLHHLRRALGDTPWIVFERNGYRLVRATSDGQRCATDVDDMLAVAGEVSTASARRTAPDLCQLQHWLGTLDALGDDLLPGNAMGDWIVPHQDRIRHAWRQALDAITQVCRAHAQWDGVQLAARALITRDPLREGAHRAYMESLAAVGEGARALAHANDLEALLRREVGARLSSETRALVERIRREA